MSFACALLTLFLSPVTSTERSGPQYGFPSGNLKGSSPHTRISAPQLRISALTAQHFTYCEGSPDHCQGKQDGARVLSAAPEAGHADRAEPNRLGSHAVVVFDGHDSHEPLNFLLHFGLCSSYAWNQFGQQFCNTSMANLELLSTHAHAGRAQESHVDPHTHWHRFHNLLYGELSHPICNCTYHCNMQPTFDLFSTLDDRLSTIF
jgi:hypothetical protein